MPGCVSLPAGSCRHRSGILCSLAPPQAHLTLSPPKGGKLLRKPPGRAKRVEEIERGEKVVADLVHTIQTANDPSDRFVELEGAEPLARRAGRANQGGRNRGMAP